jgi:hypothetical protein
MNAKLPKEALSKFFSELFTIKETADKNEIRINSIYTNDEKYHLYINLEKGMFNDFKSGTSGHVNKLIAEILDIPESQVFVTIIKRFSNKDIFLAQTVTEVIKEQSEIKVPEHTFWFSEVKVGIFRDRAYEYLKNRKIKEEYINEFGYCTGGDFEKRIIIPFWENKKLVYYVARDYSGKNEMRYKNPVGISNRDFIYNYDKIKEGCEVVIAEGIMDILSLDNQIGFPILSAHLSKTQITKLFEKIPRRIILVPDRDKTGELTLQRNIDLLYTYKPASVKTEFYVYYIPDKFKDLNEMKVKTGKNFIDLYECRVIDKRASFSIDKIFGL